ncbi:uncharacterized protein SCHCODRAFT_02590762 [Schizophyllum commune H4-8]|uniref:uncharacterized protein n=1 Tax=Schizophyllum commune (strain H4-8 / FGSC 9210) TaxID=578458 RepID=UPI00215F3622|nr:uncharacterized protein SCHCODRAFT_02590762 [Schizophyllum commune H4-8]KAI5887111.1 hypothetical protein SCHCODRAFT_02590762 [Schizophyllum commune H4-8]
MSAVNPASEICPLEQEFDSFISTRKSPYRAKLFQHRCVKEVIARLHPSRIPSYPLNEQGAQAISEALQAWRIYSLLSACLFNSDKEFRTEYLAHLPHAWQWALFLLPGEGNVKDLRGLDFQTPSFPLRPDGTVAATVYMRYRMLLLALVALLDDPARLPACQRLPRFGEVFLALATYEWPRPRNDDLAALIHDLMRTLRAGTTRKGDFSKQFMHDLRANVEKHPGVLLRVVFERFPWLLDPGNDELSDDDRNLYAEHYGIVIVQLLASLHDPILNGFRDNGGAKTLVKALLRAIPYAPTREVLVEKAQASITRLIIHLTMRVLDEIFAFREADDAVADAVDAGLIIVIDRLRRLLSAEVLDEEEQKGARSSVEHWLDDVLTPTMVRLDVLRALTRRNYGIFLSEMRKEAEATWPALRDAAERYASLFPRMLMFKARLKALRSRGCSNAECQHAQAGITQKTHLKICSCATAMYCSAECQKVHWRSGQHRGACSNEASRLRLTTQPLKDPGGDPIITSIRPHLRYLEYHFLRFCALTEIALLYEAGKMTDGVKYTVEFQHSDIIKSFSTELPFTLEPHTILVELKAHWGAGLEMCIDIPDPVTFSELEDLIRLRKTVLGM